MGILARSLGFNNFSLEDPAQPLLPYSALYESLGLGRSDAGVLMNQKQALRISTVYACVRIISEDLSRLSLDIFERMPDGAIRLATEHRLYSLLHDRPNPNMSSMVWRGTMVANVSLSGNAYSLIKRDRANRAVGLYPLDPNKTSPVSVQGKLMFATTQTPTGQVEYADPEDMLHFMGLSLDGMVGMSPIDLCKNTFGLNYAAEKFGAQFFGNGARASAIFTHPSRLDPESYENLRKSLHEVASGDNALRPILLEEGMTYNQLSVNPHDAQFIELRKFSKETVAECFRVPMHLLQDLSRSSLNNIEHMGRDYVQYCLAPLAVKMEQEINFKLGLTDSGFFSETNFLELERGDFASQTTGLLAMRNGGVFSANDCLKALRLNPIPAEQGGDIRIVPLAMTPLDSLLITDDEPVQPEKTETDTDEGVSVPIARSKQQILVSRRKEHILTAYRVLVRDAIGRALNRKNDADFVSKAFSPIVSSMKSTILAQYSITKLDESDEAQIIMATNAIVADAAKWTKAEASALATALTEQLYIALEKPKELA